MALEALPAQAEKGPAVRRMFDTIAPRYDLMNRLMTLGLDQAWRRTALDAIAIGPGDRVIDIACGTGDIAEQARARGARVCGMDCAREMLRGATGREIDAGFVQADVAALPLADGSVTAITCGFALRNFVALPDVFQGHLLFLTAADDGSGGRGQRQKFPDCGTRTPSGS